MNTINLTPQPEVNPPSRPVWPWLLGGALALSLGANMYQANKSQALTVDLGNLRKELTTMKGSIEQQQADVRKSLENVEQTLTATKADMSARVDQVALVAAQRQVRVLDARVQKSLAARDEKIQQATQGIEEVKEATLTASTKISDINNEVGNVKTDVGAVKTEVANTKSELDKTIADLKRARGDMGEMSGLIATNSKELSALREIGERNYFEFNIDKKAGVQKVGDVQLVLKKADAKRSRYTMQVVVDDNRRIEKKDKTLHEPVQFYGGSRARQPYEVVVYEVQKDRVVGYLAAPKAQLARN